MQIKCEVCGEFLTRPQIESLTRTQLESDYFPYENDECPFCKQTGHLQPQGYTIKRTSKLKPVIDIALNFGLLLQAGECQNYGYYDYYEEIIRIAEEFLNTPADEKDTLYVEAIDKFSSDKLRKKFGGK